MAEKERLCTMTETEIRAYMTGMEEEAAGILSAAQEILDRLAEMGAVLTVGTGSGSPPLPESPRSSMIDPCSGGLAV